MGRRPVFEPGGPSPEAVSHFVSKVGSESRFSGSTRPEDRGSGTPGWKKWGRKICRRSRTRVHKWDPLVTSRQRFLISGYRVALAAELGCLREPGVSWAEFGVSQPDDAMERYLGIFPE